MAGIDLHTHTNRSDGTFTPSELVHRAADLGLEVLGLTDHDTTDGLEEGLAVGARLGVEVIPGVELSAELDGSSVHVLGYWMDPEDPPLQQAGQGRRNHRAPRWLAARGHLPRYLSPRRVGL